MTPPAQKLRIIVGGLVGQFPLGGVAWDYFHYLLGLDQLGHDVYYHEDTWVWPYHPVLQHPVDKPYYTVQFFRNFFRTYAPQLSGKWHYNMCHEHHYGMTAAAFAEVAETADIFLNVSGACFIPPELGPKCLKVFLDTDPGYNQMLLCERYDWSKNIEQWCAQVAQHDRHLTYAENIFGADCRVPRMDFDWRPTRCVVTLPQWSAIAETPIPDAAPMTTIMTWDWFKGHVIHDGVEYGTKFVEYNKFHDLPLRVDVPLALAINGFKAPHRKIKRDGWRILDANDLTLTPAKYQSLIAASAGEWSVAKNIYVATHSGWFSCRTACYLAAARPAVVQETGWSKFLPSGQGLIAFRTMDEAIAALRSVAADPRAHRRWAFEIAREYLAGDRVLPPMIDAIYKAAEKPRI